jgi:hypothetical protein
MNASYTFEPVRISIRSTAWWLAAPGSPGVISPVRVRDQVEKEF